MYYSKFVGITLLKFGSATRHGILKSYLTMDTRLSHLSWKPRSLDSFFIKDFNFYHLQQLTTCYPNIGLSLHFYYANLEPNNIIVSEKGNLKEIPN